MINRALVDYIIADDENGVCCAALYEYVTAGNGLFVRARKPQLEVCFQIARANVRGLPELAESFDWELPRVPVAIVERILTEARQAALADLEKLFHLHHDGECWYLDVPEQSQSGAACRSLDDASTNRAQIELHSHHNMQAFFSGTDNRDEQGFKIYAVIGRVLDVPEMRVRVGVHGRHHEIPAEWVFEMPDGLRDCNEH